MLASLRPEGPSVCHHVLVHPPGGIVGGDTLDIGMELGAGSHALLTTPGATRFYRSDGRAATQSVEARLERGARLEWLPLETIAYSGTQAANRMRFELAEGAEMIGWDVLALGLPAAHAPFVAGSYRQEIEVPGAWLERGRIAGTDAWLLDSPLGWAGHRVLATLWCASGARLDTGRRQALVDAARELASRHALAATAGVTALDERVVVLRALAARVEPAMSLLMAVWGRWRQAAWGLAAHPPRVWRT